MTASGLRERKKERTRQALYEAATRLFLAQGYTRTTVAEIAAEAGVSVKTLFNHFAGKEDLLLGYRRQRIDVMAHVLADELKNREPDEALARTAEHVIDWVMACPEPSLDVNLAQARLILAEPELRARSLDLLWELERRLAAVLRDAHPTRYDEVAAATVVGGLLGALSAAMRAALERGDSPTELAAAARQAIQR
ncbi:TetR/AcrR family transcriptional regulator [Actinophytocola sp.]|uniref:TetR/AcrR family transcriptional regulator n=1 Tax=Actinophytocola sp. TaxID=1872138 RepID=UPI002ED56799